ncbi:MAG: helicase-related protein [Aminivibrio sp.]|uniref:DEAD/DEAH box helicase n=1 Tax=Aminivibrio sp. TaxID=1872489 RepID=UPI002B2130F0|nr:DEAD/DEAH box helicase [Aminivibrio sp.]MEA4952492.1 helicase-related protein [Aminivibrio sp.]
MRNASAPAGNRIWDLDERLWTGGTALHLPLDGAARCWICRNPASPALVVFPDTKQAALFCSDWETLFPGERVLLLHEIPLTPHGVQDRALPVQRGETLARWKEEGGILAASGGALLGPVYKGSRDIRITTGKEYRRENLLDWLVHAGYERSDIVWAPGQFIFRGYILDVFDPAYAHPLRFEFFDETVESVRSFSPRTQTSVGLLDGADIHSLSTSKEASLFSFFPENAVSVFFEPAKTEVSADSYALLWKDIVEAEGRGVALPGWNELFLRLASRPRLRVTASASFSEAGVSLEEIPPFRGNMDKFWWMGDSWKKDGYSLFLATKNRRILSFGEEASVFPVDGTLSKGFLDPVSRIAYISDLELAGISEKITGGGMLSAPPREWSDRLSEGQLLVHEDYGLCVFRGSEEVSVAGEMMDSLILEFDGSQRLFLPVLQLHKITPLPDHMSGDVRLDSLRGVKWKKSVAKTRERVQQEIRGLLELYAKRELVEGFAFPPPDGLYREFEEAFPHVETKDQLTASAEVAADMESPYPMDRLLVGDVGYGKTEVAVRAAFKAVQGGKQAAVLVPTTILAQQHYMSFTARMTGFPVNVALLSRFSSKKEQRTVLEETASGRVDILIGTARMLQKDVAFKDLGLIVVDEEHRFGVLSKEKLKEARENVDVLMLSATPIPRTLALSLKGMRSISLLNEPPHNRVPVITAAGPWNTGIVRSAVARELERGGQVFYVSNRIYRLDERASFLRKLFPSAALGIAHGRMKESELEETMLKFYNRQLDILLCTTIIESGLDVPGANTLIVEDCQELGLAQMYQLRGRVGRREESSFAYFLYPEGHPLGKETLERLDAITTLNEGGAGYDLALEDLRIRGSGDLLGTSQHGTERGRADSYLYYAMLEEEIAKLRGTLPSSAEVTADIPCLIQASYIPQETIRIALYRRLLRVDGPEELRELEKEVQDRFGPLPEALKNLFSVSLLRSRGGKYGILSVECGKRDTVLRGSGPAFDDLKKRRNWYASEGKVTGPGGYTGLADVLSVLRHGKQVR